MSQESRYAHMALRLLLCEQGPVTHNVIDTNDLVNVDWDVILPLVKRNVLTIRTFRSLSELGISIPSICRDEMSKEQVRISKTMELIAQIDEMLGGEKGEFVFTKSFQHYPDMGHDVDLFVLDRSQEVDVLIDNVLSASALKGSLCHKLAGKQGYEIRGYPSPIEIHHGRLGHVGEHTIYPEMLVRNRRRITMDGIATFVPSPEDQLIMQVMQRMYSHLCIRLSDFIHSVLVIRQGDLDWDYIVGTTEQIGIFDGLRCYLQYVNQIYNELFGRDIIPPERREMLARGGIGEIRLKGYHYSFPTVKVVGRLYAKRIFAALGSLNWSGAARMCFLIPLAVLTGFRFFARRGALLIRSIATRRSRVEGDV